MQAGVVVQQLDVARLQRVAQRQLRRGGKLVEQRHGFVVLRRQAGDLREALAQAVVVVAVVDGQVPLHRRQRCTLRMECAATPGQDSLQLIPLDIRCPPEDNRVQEGLDGTKRTRSIPLTCECTP